MRGIMIFGISLALLSGLAVPTRAEEIVCSEYCVVTFQLATGAPASVTVESKEVRYNPAMGEANQRRGTWAAGGSRAMVVNGYLFPVSNPVVDVTPDTVKAGEPLECRVVVKADRLGVPIYRDDYEFTWGRMEDKKFVAADLPKGPKLAAGITKDGERWACLVQPKNADGTLSQAQTQDEVDVGKSTPGDSRRNSYWGWVYGQWRHCRGYLKFDVSTLAGKKIKGAKLRLFCDVQMPSWELQAHPSPNTWNEREVTWVNQPVPFPYKGEPLGKLTLTFGPEPTEENPATPGDTWYSHSPKGGLAKNKTAPDWREIDLTDYVRKCLAEGRKELSVCLAGATHSKNDHARVIIFNEKHMKDDKDRGDMRPRLAVETE